MEMKPISLQSAIEEAHAAIKAYEIICAEKKLEKLDIGATALRYRLGSAFVAIQFLLLGSFIFSHAGIISVIAGSIFSSVGYSLMASPPIPNPPIDRPEVARYVGVICETQRQTLGLELVAIEILDAILHRTIMATANLQKASKEAESDKLLQDDSISSEITTGQLEQVEALRKRSIEQAKAVILALHKCGKVAEKVGTSYQKTKEFDDETKDKEYLSWRDRLMIWMMTSKWQWTSPM